ncbi:stage V sporulation protein B [Clostridium sp. BJN0001]|uniref:stage V sporulation protein B n=1 Tax=Clostridium sp. BJN0001 TaxID=2930219 RepID=UPI001FD5BB13|nr:stage V sporulation protein B [Clostridium sp. BJN0001]
MSRDNFFKSTFLLIISNIIIGFLSFLFSIYISKVLSAEGMGLYNLVMPIYNLFICLMSAGVVASVSQITAVYIQKKEYCNIKMTIRTLLFFNILWASIIGISVFFLAPYISKYAIKDVRTLKALRIICPAMVFIASSNIFKGYFYGSLKIKVPAVIDIIEKSMRIVTVSIFFLIIKNKTLDNLVAAATSSLCFGEFQSLIFLYIYYCYEKSKMPISKCRHESRIQLLFNVIVISVPLCLNGFLTNILGTISTLIIPRRLIHAGFTYSESLSLIGRYNGMALNLITIPLIAVSTINTLLIPDLSKSLNEGNNIKIQRRIKKVIKSAFLLGLCTAVICNIIPHDLGYLFYKRTDLGNYIRFASLSSPIFFTATTMFGILNGLNRQKIILRNSFIEASLELILLYFFTGIKFVNIYGEVLTTIIACSVGFILNIHEVKKHVDIDINFTNVIIYILLSILTFVVINIFAKNLFSQMIFLKVLFVTGISGFIFVYLSFFGEN